MVSTHFFFFHIVSFYLSLSSSSMMSSEGGSDSGKKALSWGRVNEKQLKDWHKTYRILDDIEFIVRVDDPSLGCVALNQAVMAAGLRLPFPKIVRKFLCEWRIAPTQFCPSGWRILIGFIILWDQLGFHRPLVLEFNSLYSFKVDGKKSGWWYAFVKAKT
ncbi:Plus3 domain-containing protein [Abeliophyllum distichum]|uniref:Plus3 domain-containing protein n=1 Tax=Abeliophyllum distichum TaxID=126358 RepID=A0ABD1Q785_9LAMI